MMGLGRCICGDMIGAGFLFEKTKKKRIRARLDELYSPKLERSAVYGRFKELNNFEFIMNRTYALILFERNKIKDI